jgi:hypothetical protein
VGSLQTQVRGAQIDGQDVADVADWGERLSPWASDLRIPLDLRRACR